MKLVRTILTLAWLGLASAAPAMAQQNEYCGMAPGKAAAERAAWKYGDSIVTLSIVANSGWLANFYVGESDTGAQLFPEHGNVSARRWGDGVIRFSFTDNSGARGEGAARKLAADEFELVLSRNDGQPAPGYGRHILSKTACAKIDAAYETEFRQDNWRYLPAHSKQAAEAVHVAWNSRRLIGRVFRATCAEPRDLVLEYLYDSTELVESDKDDPIVIGLWQAGQTEPFAAYSLKTTDAGGRMTGRLRLDAGKAAGFDRAASITLDAPNGPGNMFDGGKSLALKRIVRECGR